MNIYSLIRLVTSKALPPSVKLLGLLCMHVAGKRTIGIFLDPVLACNLKCKMCYFSSPEHKPAKGMLRPDDYEALRRSLFHRALKLQIGCGAEPTLYSRLHDLVSMAKKAGIPYVSITTNGQLLSGNNHLAGLVHNGLDEITLSMHGTCQETYEELMPGASFEKLLDLIARLRDIKKNHPDFKIRVNFTVNSRNVYDLEDDKFFALWGKNFGPDIIQLRPVQNLGDSEWKDFDLSILKEKYASSIGNVVSMARERNITCLAPEYDQLDQVTTEQDSLSSVVEDITYCYVAPGTCYHPDFNLQTDTYESYHRRIKTSKRILRSIFHTESRERRKTKKMNYHVK